MRSLRQAVVAASAVAAAALLPAAADAAPAHNGTFTPSGQPGHITRGPDGNMWFAISGSSANKELGRIADDGTITEYDTPGDHPITDLAPGPDVAGGANTRIWMTYEGGVIKWDPVAGTGTAHPIAGLMGPRGITRDNDGNLFAVAVDRLVKISPAGAKLDNVQTNNVAGRGITLGSDGRVWVADFGNQAVTAIGTAAPYNKQSYATGGGPQEIVAGPAGQLGFSNPGNQMGRVTTGGAVTQVTDAGTDAFGVAFAGDGAYWYAQFATNSLGRLTTGGQYTRALTLPAGSGPRYLAAGPGNTLWVTAETSKRILRITGVLNGGGGGGGGGADTKAPKLSSAKVNGGKRRFTSTLDETATLRLRVDQKLRGQRRGGKCRAPRRGAKRNCNYWKKRRTLLVEGKAGKNTVSLGRKLGAGKYRLVVTATDKAGNRSKRTIAFTVKAKKRKR